MDAVTANPYPISIVGEQNVFAESAIFGYLFRLCRIDEIFSYFFIFNISQDALTRCRFDQEVWSSKALLVCGFMDDADVMCVLYRNEFDKLLQCSPMGMLRDLIQWCRGERTYVCLEYLI